MKRMIATIIAAMLTAAAQAAPTDQCVYSQVQIPGGRWVTCITCGSFTSCS